MSAVVLKNPRVWGDALVQLAEARESRARLAARLKVMQPYARIGEAVTTDAMSVSLRNALYLVREVKSISMWDFFALLRAVDWVKKTPHDTVHRPTPEAIAAGYVERVYFPGSARSYWPAITPTGIEMLKYALSTGKIDILKI
jgi:hypothetical protein